MTVSNPRTHAQTLAHIRLAWQAHLETTGGKLTENNAEDFLVSAQDALRTLADELRAQLRLGVAEAVHVFWDDESNEWRAAVYLQDGRRKRCLLSEYVELPAGATEDDLRRAVVEFVFVHNVRLERHEVEVDVVKQFASWGDCSTWKGAGR